MHNILENMRLPDMSVLGLWYSGDHQGMCVSCLIVLTKQMKCNLNYILILFMYKDKYLDPRICERPNTYQFVELMSPSLFIRCLNQPVLLLYFFNTYIFYLVQFINKCKHCICVLCFRWCVLNS